MNTPTAEMKAPLRLPRDEELKYLRTRLVRMIAAREAQKHIDKKTRHPA